MSDERAKRIPVPVIHTVGACQCCRQRSACMCHVRAAEYNELLAENERLKAGWDTDAALCKEYHLQALRLEQQVAELRAEVERWKHAASVQ